MNKLIYSSSVLPLLMLVSGCTLPGLAPPISSNLQTEANDILSKKMVIHQLELSLKAIDQQPVVMMLPSPVMITPPPPPSPPVIITPAPPTGIPGSFPSSPSVTPSLRKKSGFYIDPDQLANHLSSKEFWKEHPPSFNMTVNPSGLITSSPFRTTSLK